MGRSAGGRSGPVADRRPAVRVRARRSLAAEPVVAPPLRAPLPSPDRGHATGGVVPRRGTGHFTFVRVVPFNTFPQFAQRTRPERRPARRLTTASHSLHD